MGDLIKSGGGGLIGLLHSQNGELTMPKPFEREIFLFDTYIAGTSFIEGIEELEQHLNEGDKLDFFREKKTDISTLFDGFSHFGKAFVLMILMGVKIFLWTLLFIVPGIIAAFRYSQAFYVLIDHPEYSPNQCLKESSLMMKGNKWKYFCLELSFIGWIILASVPAGILSGLNLGISGGLGTIILTIIMAIPALFVDVYMNVAVTVFYELAADNLVIMEAGQSFPEGRWDEPERETNKSENEDERI